MTRKHFLSVVALVTIGSLSLVACSEENARERDEKASENILEGYQQSQPIPQANWSQLRQTLIDIETAQIETTATTTFFFNQGSADPISSCPSIGFPVPSTYQLTNPEQLVHDGAVIPQVESNGVFTGDTSGTYALCVNDNGDAYAFYWEGFVAAVAGPATWDSESHTVRLTGDPTFDFSEGKK